MSLPARAQRCFSMERLTSDSLAACCVPRRRTRTALHCRYKAQRRAPVPILWHGLRRFHSRRRGCLAGLVRLILTQAGPNFKYLLSSSDLPSPSGRKPSRGPRPLGRPLGTNRSSPIPSIVMKICETSRQHNHCWTAMASAIARLQLHGSTHELPGLQQ